MGVKKSASSTFMHMGLWLMLMLLVNAPQPAQAASCTPEEEEKAEALSDGHLKNWHAVDAFYKNLRQCDDGGIAEGLSDSVVNLLSQKWDTLAALNALTAKDPGLKQFVLQHIDSTADDEDLHKIVRQAKTRCPSGQQSLCSDIANAAAQALQNMRTGAN